MEEKRLSNKSLVAFSLLLLSVVAGVILLFVMRPAVEREGIVLPDPVVENTQELPQSSQMQTDFLTIDPNNVVDVLSSLEAPSPSRPASVAHTMVSTLASFIRLRRMLNCLRVASLTMYCHASGRMGR